ncbi:MAG: hypothetical protein M3Q39_14210 [Actinomycetota bacterium]|nr:hypothetical protein [Actinomycetota bacterium]
MLTSARDVVARYEHVLTELPVADRDLLLGARRRSKRTLRHVICVHSLPEAPRGSRDQQRVFSRRLFCVAHSPIRYQTTEINPGKVLQHWPSQLIHLRGLPA